MLVPATTVPVTIIGAFAAMAALGFSINLPTLFALILAIGIVVDDAIVIVEGVSRYVEQGMPGREAAGRAMDDLTGPVIGITLVLMSVFIPAAFLPGLTGQLYRQFALVIAATAFISAINADDPEAHAKRVVAEAADAGREAQLFCSRLQRRLRRRRARLCEAHGRDDPPEPGDGGPRAFSCRRRGLGTDPGADRLPADRGPGLPDRRRAAARRRLEGAHGCGDGNKISKIAGAVPGVDHVVTVSGISIFDNLASLANAGVAFVILKDWDVRLKEPGRTSARSPSA